MNHATSNISSKINWRKEQKYSSRDNFMWMNNYPSKTWINGRKKYNLIFSCRKCCGKDANKEEKDLSGEGPMVMNIK